ncbi:MAG: hypothetical protein A4S17_13160 [Proteobacteria bacterium HN_bin10]|jgi:hypothetical protein|nr:MAG: hypothetical protein A4S17_13160 [Proteobacteria bacterium HN_bin10]
MDTWTALAISAASGLGAAVVTVWLSLRQFQQQRWWERKLDAYTQVVEALHHMTTFLDADLAATGLGAPSVGGGRSVELNAKYKKANADLARIIDMGELLLSRRAIRELREMCQRIETAEKRSDTHMDYLSRALSAVLECQKKFLPIARRDLKLSRGLFPLGM